jgi:hypothetical protein
MKYKNTQDDYIFTKMIDDEDMNMRIVNRIADAGDEVYQVTNVKADVTMGNYHTLYPEFRKLADIVEDFCKESTIEMNMDFENHHYRINLPQWRSVAVESLKVNMMCGIRYTSGEVCLPHNHWPAQWAFTYYIDPPEGCSNLVFPTIGTEIEVEHGKLIVFQGSTIHETVAKQFEGERFTVSGTVTFAGANYEPTIFSGGQR